MLFPRLSFRLAATQPILSILSVPSVLSVFSVVNAFPQCLLPDAPPHPCSIRGSTQRYRISTARLKSTSIVE